MPSRINRIIEMERTSKEYAVNYYYDEVDAHGSQVFIDLSVIDCCI